MKRTLTALAFCTMAGLGLGATASTAQASALSAGAGTTPISIAASEKTDLVQVKHRDRHWKNRRHDRRHWHRHRDRDHRWRQPRSGIYFQFGTGGHRYAPPAYQVRPRYVAPRRALPAAHVNWCHAQYRSYRVSDNSFQPYNGPRRACVSPYWR